MSSLISETLDEVSSIFADKLVEKFNIYGSELLTGSGPPDNSLGVLGNFYFDSTNNNLYGPKGLTGWGSGIGIGSNHTGSSLPDQTGHTGEFLTTNGSVTSWAEVPLTSPAGANGNIQFKTGSSFDASPNLTWDGTRIVTQDPVQTSTGLNIGSNLFGAGYYHQGVQVIGSGVTLVLDNSGGDIGFRTNYTNRFSISNTGDISLNGKVTITPQTSSTVGQIIQLLTSQTGDAFQVKTSGSSTIAKITAAGNLTCGNLNCGNITAGTIASGTHTITGGGLSFATASTGIFANAANCEIQVLGSGGRVLAETVQCDYLQGYSNSAPQMPYGAVDSNGFQITLPDQTSAAGLYLKSVAGVPTWAAGASPGGSNTQIQFNSSGAFGGSTNLTWDGTNFTIGTDAKLKRDAANILAMTNGVNIQRFRTYTGTNYLGTPDYLELGHNWQNSGFFGLQARPSSNLNGFIIGHDRAQSGVGIGLESETPLYCNASYTLIKPYDSSAIGLVVRGKASQSGNLQEWQDSTTAVLVSIGPGGATNISAPFSVGAMGGNKTFLVNDANTSPYSVHMWSGCQLGWCNSPSAGGAADDTILIRDGVGILAQKNGSNRQIFRVYQDATNCMEIGTNWAGTGYPAIQGNGSYPLIIESQNGGYGLYLSAGGNTQVQITNTTTLVHSAGSSAIPLTVKGAASQSANLQEWQDSTGAVQALVTPYGAFRNQQQIISWYGQSTECGIGLSNSGTSAGIHFGISSDTEIYKAAAGVMHATDCFEMPERGTAPATPASGNARYYFEDNGSGKQRLVIKWDDGSTTVVATQP